MKSLDQLKEKSGQFIRTSLPSIRKAAVNMPTIPKFRAKPGDKKGTHKFIETTQPNWWQARRILKESFYGTPDALELITLFENTRPFSEIISKSIVIPARGTGVFYKTGTDIVNTMLISYLFSSGCERWQRHKFNKIWSDCVTYFDPNSKTVEYYLYAPISTMPGVTQKIKLNDGLTIRRLSAARIAQLASLDSNLAGYTVSHRFTRWTSCFIEKRFELEKTVLPEGNFAEVIDDSVQSMQSRINEEVCLIRCLLNETPAITTFSFIRDGYPRDPGGGVVIELPWRARLPRWVNPPGKTEVGAYKKRRARFLSSHGEPGWESVFISMRRFAVAWENPFRADILADIVAALEQLVVKSDREVGYKLRTRVAYLLGKTPTERKNIVKNIKDAYSYRSDVFHGGYVFDDPGEFRNAKRVRKAKGKRGNPFHDSNEVHRLIYTMCDYYRNILKIVIDRTNFKIDWEEKAL